MAIIAIQCKSELQLRDYLEHNQDRDLRAAWLLDLLLTPAASIQLSNEMKTHVMKKMYTICLLPSPPSAPNTPSCC